MPRVAASQMVDGVARSLPSSVVPRPSERRRTPPSIRRASAGYLASPAAGNGCDVAARLVEDGHARGYARLKIGGADLLELRHHCVERVPVECRRVFIGSP